VIEAGKTLQKDAISQYLDGGLSVSTLSIHSCTASHSILQSPCHVSWSTLIAFERPSYLCCATSHIIRSLPEHCHGSKQLRGTIVDQIVCSKHEAQQHLQLIARAWL